MTSATNESALTIIAEAPDAGPEAFKGAFFFWALAIAIVVGDLLWVGYPAAFAINARDFNPLPLFGVLCTGLFGTVQLASATVHSLRFRKFGSSALVVSPPRLGEKLKGLVRTSQDLSPLGDFKVRLRCDLHTTDSTGGKSTSGMSCLWEGFETIPASTHSSAGIPIELVIPENGLATGAGTNQSNSSARARWSLEVRAPLRGLDYYAEFSLPVKGRAHDNVGSVATAATKRGTSGPFAGYDQPRSQRWKWLLRILVMFGVLITVAASFGILGELRATRVGGHVTAFHSPILDVAIENIVSPPITAHIERPGRGPWSQGAAVELICDDLNEGTYSCDIDSGIHWWLQTGSVMAIGVAMLTIAVMLWRRRRWWA